MSDYFPAPGRYFEFGWHGLGMWRRGATWSRPNLGVFCFQTETSQFNIVAVQTKAHMGGHFSQTDAKNKNVDLGFPIESQGQ